MLPCVTKVSDIVETAQETKKRTEEVVWNERMKDWCLTGLPGAGLGRANVTPGLDVGVVHLLVKDLDVSPARLVLGVTHSARLDVHLHGAMEMDRNRRGKVKNRSSDSLSHFAAPMTTTQV